MKGTLSSAQTVDVIVTGGTATPYGVDYTFGTQNFLTVTIPAGTYDGTAATAVTITPPILNNDTLVEGGETIPLAFANLSSALTVGDSNANATTQSTHIYTITDDEKSITYLASSLTETSANTGAFSATIGFTLAGDTFTTVGVQTPGTKYTVANVPAGLTAVVTTTSATAGTIAFTGNATSHANANDVTNATIAFTNAAFTSGNAVAVVGSTKSNISLDFIDQTITYSGPGFTETAANNGAVTGSIVATVAGATFANAGSTFTPGSQVVLGNVPAGLTPVLTVNGAGTTVTLTLTGNATSHANANDVANITFAFADSAFAAGALAANVTNATGPATTNLGVDFRDVTLTYATTTFPEVAANNGTITTTSALTLAGDTFTLSAPGALFTAGTHFNATNVPAGMTLTITAVDSTHATVALTGTATNHANANDVANLTITWNDAAFTATPAANITNSAKNNFIVDFNDPASIVYTGSFVEPAINNGSVTGTRVATLTGDTFISSIADGSPFTLAHDYTITGVPAGLTAVLIKTSPTVATLILSGNATSHLSTNSISNLTITFLDGVFTSTPLAANVAGYTNATGVITFRDVTLTYS